MTEQLQARLKEIAKECGGNRALCEKSGVSERTFANWLAGSSEPKIIGIAAIARAAGVTIDWIVNGSKPKQPLGAHVDEESATVQVPYMGKSLSGINGALDERLEILDYVPFSKAFLEKRVGHCDFEQLCVLEIQGDSMVPTMSDGDFVLIDRKKAKFADGVYAFLFRDQVNVKRIINVVNGVEVISDNQSLYPPFLINNADLKEAQIIGRILWVGKRIP